MIRKLTKRAFYCLINNKCTLDKGVVVNMSDFVLHYDILEGIAKSSNSLGRQADEYANSLTSRIANAITSVTGSSSGYLEDASYYVNEKVGQLQKKAQEFFDFAEQVTMLAETATRVDEEVQKLLAENQEEFLSHHESLRIEEWKVDILNWLVGIKNKLPFLEVLGNILSAIDTILESFSDTIKYWYHCEGGKYILEFIGGIALAALAVAIFVFTFPASGFMAICGVIGAGIAAVNAITNVATSFRAAYTACNGDPTWARIYSKQDTLSQVIRETNFNNRTLNGLSYLGADLLDTTEVFCSIVGIGQIGLSIKKLFSKANFNIFKKGSLKLGNFKANIKNSFANAKISIKKGVTDLKVNIKNIFGKTKNLDDMADLNKLDDIPANNIDDLLPKGGSKTNNRPSWRQSELDASKQFPEYAEQKSFIDGKEVPYGTKGSVRPDLYKEGSSIDVKNYNVESTTGRSNLAKNIEKQYSQRVDNLPSGTKQTVLVDIRGQKVSNADLMSLYDDIMKRTNNGITIKIKTN